MQPRRVAPSAPDGALKLDYIERFTGAANSEKKLPMLIAIHGLGGSPERFAGRFARLPVDARIIAPRGPEPGRRRGSGWYPFRKGQDTKVGYQRSLTALHALITRLHKRHPTLGRPVVVGFSQGGTLAYGLAAQYPQSVGEIVPISARLLEAAPLGTRPPPWLRVRAIHGDDDKIIDVAEDVRTVKALKQLGFDATLTRFKGHGHSLRGDLGKAVQAQIVESLERQVSLARTR